MQIRLQRLKSVNIAGGGQLESVQLFSDPSESDPQSDSDSDPPSRLGQSVRLRPGRIPTGSDSDPVGFFSDTVGFFEKNNDRNSQRLSKIRLRLRLSDSPTLKIRLRLRPKKIRLRLRPEKSDSDPTQFFGSQSDSDPGRIPTRVGLRLSRG